MAGNRKSRGPFCNAGTPRPCAAGFGRLLRSGARNPGVDAVAAGADTLPPIAPLVLAHNSEGYAGMQPLRQQAGAALHVLQASGAQQTADAF